MVDTLSAPRRSEPAAYAKIMRSWVDRQASADGRRWLDSQLQLIAAADQKALFLTFGLIPRKLGKDDLKLTSDDLAHAATLRERWQPVNWTVDQAARTVLLLTFPSRELERYVETLDKLFAAGEVGELVALYQALPLLPHVEAHLLRAAEGIRTNIKGVFCAVAHNNPYPAEQLDDGRWNQMVLKSLFVGVPLYPIVGLDERGNLTLMRMLTDYAHERWAAGRKVPPELWRLVGPFADKNALLDLERTCDKGDPLEQQAAALAVSQCPHKDAAEILRKFSGLEQQVKQGQLDWNEIGKASEAAG